MNTNSKIYRDIIINSLENEKFNNIIEIGCGEADNLIAISKKFKNIDIFGIDISKERIISGIDNISKEKINNIKIEVMDGKYLDYPYKYFDIVFTFAVLLMVDDETAFSIIKNSIRIAKKKVIFIELCSDNGELSIEDGRRQARNYEKILNNLGVNNIEKILVPKEIWPGISYNNSAYIIKVKI